MAKSKNSEWLETTERFVVCLDFLGFKDRVARQPHNEIFEKMKLFLRDFEHLHNVTDGSIRVVNFSDSIFIFSKDSSEDCYQKIVGVSTLIISNAMINGFPIKGASAFGKISISKDFQIFFGQPIIDAHLLQEEVYYCGLVIHNTFEKQSHNYPDFGSMLPIYTPMKSGKIYHCNYEWFSTVESWIPTTNKSVNDVFFGLYQDVSGKPRTYIDNTRYMYEEYLKTKENKRLKSKK